MKRIRSFSSKMAVATVSALAVVLASHGLSLADQLSDGSVAFTAPPRVIAASTTRQSTTARNATYYFTLDLPANAGEPLGKVVITPLTGTHWMRSYDTEATEAFVGDRYSRGADLAISSVVEDPETLAVTISFAQPVSPGQVITIALIPTRTPRSGGSYDFEVTTFPSGGQGVAQYAGVMRLNFFESDGNDPFL